MPEWIHNRAEHLLAKNPDMKKSTAFAVATQQSHALGKTPKGYGTPEGKHEAKQKFDTPKDDVKSANPGHLESPKMASWKGPVDELTHVEYEVMLQDIGRKRGKPADPKTVARVRQDMNIPKSWKWHSFAKDETTPEELSWMKHATFMAFSDELQKIALTLPQRAIIHSAVRLKDPSELGAVGQISRLAKGGNIPRANEISENLMGFLKGKPALGRGASAA